MIEIDKSAWGDGPWQNEPDRVEYMDRDTGLPCLIKRNPHLGFLCGYVGVKEGHPWFKKRYDDDQTRGVDAHGGLTFAGWWEPDMDTWWLGFDCGHYLDMSPHMARKHPDLYGLDHDEQYRTIEFVKEQLRQLAKQAGEAYAKQKGE